MWRGAISFGLVTIPVRLYAATEQRDVAFRQVHQSDGGRIRFRRICSACGEEVPFSDIAKGYELPDGGMVVLTDDDLADLPLPTTHSIEVVNFTSADQLDPLLYARGYYSEPDTAGLRAYALLRGALEKSGKVGIARVALRQRESLAALRARGGVLVLETLLWPDEVREPDFAFLDQEIAVRPQELTMAASLIDSMTTDFDPSEYHDHYREAVEELVAAKAEGQEVVRHEPERAEEPAGSLADALRASLAAAGVSAGASAAGDGAEGSAPDGRAPAGKPRGDRDGKPGDRDGKPGDRDGKPGDRDGEPRAAGSAKGPARTRGDKAGKQGAAPEAPDGQRGTHRRASA
jgi:DNA end-binding protein Ku